MYLTHLSLTNFRNFTRLDMDIPRGSTLLVGDNAQGKTSLLEAMYFAATFTSFHADSDREMINFLSARDPLAVARIVIDFYRGEAHHHLEARIIQEPAEFNHTSRVRKEVLLDGVKSKVNEVVGQFSAVLFLPQMLTIIEGAPDERRRYLNLALSQVVTHYPASLAEYTRTLGQRNALLKQLSERGGDQAQLDFWDNQLVTLGAQLIHARIHAIGELERLAARLHRQLTRGDEVLRLNYLPSYDPLPPPVGQYALPLDTPLDRSKISQEQIRTGFLEKLRQARTEEIARGLTTLGPHRDELRFLGNGVDLGTYGSRGQVRTAMLALKLAEVAWIKEKTGHWPVLLLDEVLAELDAQRRLDLLSRLSECDQALLTTTDLDLFTPEFTRQSSLWMVRSGTVLVDRISI